MKDWQSFSSELEEWKANPVTEQMREAVTRVLDRQEEALKQSFMQGRQDLELSRLSLLRVRQWAEDFFEASAEDVRAAIEE